MALNVQHDIDIQVGLVFLQPHITLVMTKVHLLIFGAKNIVNFVLFVNNLNCLLLIDYSQS